MKELVATIRRAPLLSSLSEGELEPLLNVGTITKVPAGEELGKEGEVAKELLLLLSGSVRTSSSENTDDPLTHSADDEPVVLGQVGMFRDATRNASVVTQTPSTVFRLPRDRFESLLESGDIGAYKVALAIGRDLADRVCSLGEGFRKLCNCCQDSAKEEDLTAFRKQLLTEWNI